MENDLFSCVGLQICGLFFLTFATIMFFRNNKEKNYSTRIFTMLIITTYLINFSEMGVYIFKSREAFTILSSLFLFFTFCWFSLFCIYLTVKLLYKDEIKDKKLIKRATLIFCLLGLALFIGSCFCNIELVEGSTHKVLNGNYIYVVYLAGTIGIGLLIYIFATKFKELDLFEKLISIFSVTSLVLFIVFQIIANFSVDDISYVLSIYVVAFYFTIEGSDYKKMIVLKESRIKAEEKSSSINSFIDEISVNAFTPLNNITNFINDSRYNRNIDDRTLLKLCDDFELEKPKIIALTPFKTKKFERDHITRGYAGCLTLGIDIEEFNKVLK